MHTEGFMFLNVEYGNIYHVKGAAFRYGKWVRTSLKFEYTTKYV